MFDDDIAGAIEKGVLVILGSLDQANLDVDVVITPRHFLDAEDNGRTVGVAVGQANFSHRFRNSFRRRINHGSPGFTSDRRLHANG